MNGRQFIARERRRTRTQSLEVRFVASQGPGSHGTLYLGARKTTVKDRKKEIGKGLLAKMLADLAINRENKSMSKTYQYPAKIERGEDGRYLVEFPDFGWGATDGATRNEALTEARDLLRELLAATMREGGNLPQPSSASGHRPLVAPPLSIALKAALHEACRESGISQRELARDHNVAESEVRQMLNPDKATEAATMERVLRQLGKRISVTVAEAA